MPASDIAGVFERHRGPYVLQVLRSTGAKAAKLAKATETLPGLHHSEDEVTAECLALLADSRDTIVAVHVWSEWEQTHVMTFNEGSF